MKENGTDEILFLINNLNEPIKIQFWKPIFVLFGTSFLTNEK